MKKILSIIIGLCLVLQIIPSLCSCTNNNKLQEENSDIAINANASPVEDFTYEFEDGNAMITGYNGSDFNIVIPEKINNRQVTTICEEAFKDYDMKSIVIPDNVKKIETSVFSHCKKLSSVHLSNNLQSLGSYCFSGCESLKNISLPDNITELAHDMFLNCEKLSSVKLPKYLKSIDYSCFVSCISLKKLTIPDNVTSLYKGAFNGCTNLEEVIMPKQLVENYKGMLCTKNAMTSVGIFIDCPKVKINGVPLESYN